MITIVLRPAICDRETEIFYREYNFCPKWVDIDIKIAEIHV